MNICEALRVLELNGGHITRDKSDPVGIYQHESDSWGDFLKHRATLTIGDLTAMDWEHKGK